MDKVITIALSPLLYSIFDIITFNDLTYQAAPISLSITQYSCLHPISNHLSFHSYETLPYPACLLILSNLFYHFPSLIFTSYYLRVCAISTTPPPPL